MAVVQDPSGIGRWVDAAGWALWASVGAGNVGTWTAEIRRDEAGLVLRAWIPPVLGGTREPRIAQEIADGAIVEVEVTGIGAPDTWGERPSDGSILDDRSSISGT